MISAYKHQPKTKIRSNIAHLKPRKNPTNTHTDLWSSKSSS